MRESYPDSIRRLLEHEGGYTNDKDDPGGPTNFGITIHDYRKYIDEDGSADDVRKMSLKQAMDIYEAKYWNALKCDELPAGVDYVVFDYGVNSGVFRAAKVLQRLVGVEDDSFIGPDTLRAVNAFNPQKLIEDICNERLGFLQALKTWPTFGKGWARRVREVQAAASVMAGGDQQPVAV